MFLASSDPLFTGHYSRLYNAKYFRNRVLRIQKLCTEFQYDSVLLVCGIDTYHDKEMKKFGNWLLHGCSGYDITNSPLNDQFSDTFCVISKDSFQAYTTPKGYPELARLSALIQNRNIYCLTPSEEANQELNEIKKISKFYEFVCDKPTIGLPAREVKATETFANELVMIEKWPICQSYGLDLVGEGFFTMKHSVKNIREALNLIYREYDSFAIHTVIYDEVPKNGHHFYDNFFSFLRDTPQKRIEKSEKSLIEALMFRYEFGLVGSVEENKREDEFPVPRVLFGENTNKEYHELSCDEQLWKINKENPDRLPVHMTLEYVERRSSLRFARTYMLSNCAINYMSGYVLDDEKEIEGNRDGKFSEQAARFISHAYISMIKAFDRLKELYFQEKIEKKDYQKAAYVCFIKACECELGLEVNQLKGIFPPSGFTIDIIKYNAMGEEVKSQDSTYLTLHMIRMQQKNITVNKGKEDLGSIIYGDSFYQTSGKSLNITNNIPKMISVYTTPKHYQNLDTNWFLEKGMRCERMGTRVFSILDCEGIYPVKSTYQDAIPNFILQGNLIVYENTVIFEDSRLHNFIVDIVDIEKVTFYISKDTWAEIQVADNSSLPMNTICEKKFYVNIKNNLYSKNMNILCEKLGEEKVEKVSQNFEQSSELFQTLEFKNYRIFTSTNKQTVYTGYLDFELFQEEYEMFMEYSMISMFNQIRNKTFVSYSQFEDIWNNAQISKKSLSALSEKTKLILVSGIPGSGKTTLGLYLSKIFNVENINSSTFVLPVQESTGFASKEFLDKLLEHTDTKTVVAVIPSYHHLKKAIFEFKKDPRFDETFDLQHVITRVSAKNFYRHKNRNMYQFLLENCLKGICDAIIFERGGVELTEFQSMRKQLCEVNDDANILNVEGRTFKFNDLEAILTKKHTKYSLLYGKYLYGFEKEGKSQYYLENAVSGHYFKFKVPLSVDTLKKRFHKIFNNPIMDYKELVPEDEQRCDFESTVDSSTDITSADEKEKIEHEETGSERIERYRKKKEEQEKKRIQADLEQEKMLIAEMKIIKSAMKPEPVIIERMKGLFLPENEEEDNDYRIISNFTEIKLKSCKNSHKRLHESELGFLVYGKNITEEKFKDIMNAFRTQLRSLYPRRTVKSITEQEIKMLEEKYFCECMPSNFFHDGYTYVDEDGNRQYSHPNLEKLIEVFIEKENAKIAEYNRGVQKEWKQDKEKYN